MMIEHIITYAFCQCKSKRVALRYFFAKIFAVRQILICLALPSVVCYNIAYYAIKGKDYDV